jgi:hypothetical protein
MKGTAVSPSIANPSPPMPDDKTLSKPRVARAKHHCSGRRSTMRAGTSQSHHTMTSRESGMGTSVTEVQP